MISKNVWVIMSKDRSVVAVGNPRDRSLKKVEDTEKDRILTYGTKGKAESAFKRHGFWHSYKDNYKDPDVELEAVNFKVEYVEQGE